MGGVPYEARYSIGVQFMHIKAVLYYLGSPGSHNCVGRMHASVVLTKRTTAFPPLEVPNRNGRSRRGIGVICRVSCEKRADDRSSWLGRAQREHS